MTETFKDIINRRRANSETKNEDVLQTLMTSTYKNGQKVVLVEAGTVLIIVDERRCDRPYDDCNINGRSAHFFDYYILGSF